MVGQGGAVAQGFADPPPPPKKKGSCIDIFLNRRVWFLLPGKFDKIYLEIKSLQLLPTYKYPSMYGFKI
jgi:hypothetical protein